MAPEVCFFLTRLEKTVEQVDDLASAEQQLTEAGRIIKSERSGDDLCDELCARRLWYTVFGKSLIPLGPCAICRVVYRNVNLGSPVQNAPSKSLSANRNTKQPRAGQCAESEALGQLRDMRHGRHKWRRLSDLPFFRYRERSTPATPQSFLSRRFDSMTSGWTGPPPASASGVEAQAVCRARTSSAVPE